MSTISLAGFKVYGSSIVEMARDMVLAGEWAKALNTFEENLEDFPMEIALAILRGDKTLKGFNDNIDVVDDNDSEDYKQTVREIYVEDYFYDHGDFFKFDRIIESRDFNYMMDMRGLYHGPHFGHQEMLNAATRYMSDMKNEKVFRLGSDRFLVARKENPNTVPMWLKRSDFAKSAERCYNIMYGIKTVEETKPVIEKEVKVKKEEKTTEMPAYLKQYRLSYLESSAKERGYNDIPSMTKDLREKVLKACEERKVSWEEVVVTDRASGETYTTTVPMQLVDAYITRDSKIWNPVCESGLKMEDDSAFHSDLWLAMGHDLNGEEYNHDNPETSRFYDIIDNLRFGYKSVGDFLTLNDVKMGSFTGKIVFEDSKEITDRDILVLPNAGLKYEKLAKKAGMVITERGGEVSHLVIVGREEMFPVIIMKDAISKLRDYESIEVDFKNNKIRGQYGLKKFY